MTNLKQDSRKRKINCFHKWSMRFKRARHVRRELSAQSASIQLLAIFAILIGKTPPIGQQSEPKPRPKSIPKEYRVMSLNEAIRHLRSPTRLTKKVIEAADRLKIYAPKASEFIDHCVRTSDFSELSRCLVFGNEGLTIRKLTAAANAWNNHDDDDPGPVPGGAALQP